jgi:HAD superfamily hydrolase (TIGR01549 family)
LKGTEKFSGEIRALLFDLDGTLRHNYPPSVDTFLEFAIDLGLPGSPEKHRELNRWTHYYWAQSPELLQDLETYPEETAFWLNYSRRSLETLECACDRVEELAAKINFRMQAEHNPENWVPEDVPSTLAALRSAGFRLAILSNRRQPCLEELETLGLGEYFDFALVAGEVSAWKPDPVIFRHALDRLGVPAAQTLYIGDNYYADILGAQNAGLQPILLDPQGFFPEAECPVIDTLGDLCRLLPENPS